MKAQWHYTRAGQQFGPYEVEMIRKMIAAGQLGPNDLMWADGMAEWVEAVRIPDFYAPAQTDISPVSKPAAATVRYAGFWRRAVAMFLDSLILTAIGIVINVANPRRGGDFDGMTAAQQGAAVGAMIGEVLVAWLYFAIQETSEKRATLGKRAMGLLVTTLKGNRISFKRATKRHFGKFISLLPLLAGFFMAAFSEKKQALHDWMAGTLVVRK